MPRRWWLALLIASAASAGCQHDEAGDEPATSEAEPTLATGKPEVTTAGTGRPTPAAGSLYAPGDVDTGLAPWIDDATTDLASQLAADPDAIEVISAVLVTWPDASLGCPEPGRQYATVATDGAILELGVDGAVYRYHAGDGRGPFLCPRPIAGAPPPGA